MFQTCCDPKQVNEVPVNNFVQFQINMIGSFHFKYDWQFSLPLTLVHISFETNIPKRVVLDRIELRSQDQSHPNPLPTYTKHLWCCPSAWYQFSTFLLYVNFVWCSMLRVIQSKKWFLLQFKEPVADVLKKILNNTISLCLFLIFP